jgi:hypothetical protein
MPRRDSLILSRDFCARRTLMEKLCSAFREGKSLEEVPSEVALWVLIKEQEE